MAHGPYEKPIRPVAKKNVATRFPKAELKAETKGAMKLVRKLKELVRREIWTKEDPNHYVDWKDNKVWAKINNEGCYYRADEVMVSCGTVTVDQADPSCLRILMVFNKNIGIYQLPKGRKNFDEGYLDTALRETSEETGVAVRPLRLRFGSRSTPPKLAQTPDQPTEKRYGIEDKLTGITEGLSNESVGINPDPATGAWRHIYWYAAKPLGDTKRDENRMTEEEDRNKFTTFWYPESEAILHLKLEDEKFMVKIVCEHIRGLSPADWSSNREREEWEDSMAKS
ncbi:hypothetical protein F4804DRAFT_353091 [Jackrogersella minutella]|nr:hypothetical protein F4804DRAFT_353091 [Jackrogersella minutella]